jgi:hypothetical protein
LVAGNYRQSQKGEWHKECCGGVFKIALCARNAARLASATEKWTAQVSLLLSFCRAAALFHFVLFGNI